MFKRIVIFLSFLISFSLLAGVTFYSRGNYNINDVNSWRSNRDGTGYAPSNFTDNEQVFRVQNGHSMTASAKWTVSGTNSYVIVESGGKITTGAFNHQITGTVMDGGTYEVTNDSYSNLGWGGNGILEANSNFILNNSSIVFNDRVSYGNLIVKAGTADCIGTTEGFEVKGTLVLDGGNFKGGVNENQNLSIANIYVQSGNFYGSDGAANVTFNISGNVTVAGGFFFGSNSTGTCTYNIGGNLLVSGGNFFGSYRSSSDPSYNTYNIGGSFNVTDGNYVAVNQSGSGYPYYYLNGTGKTLGLGDLPTDNSARHYIEILANASYTLTKNVSLGSFMQFHMRGTLDTQSYQIKAIGTNVIVNIYGLLKTANVNGFSGSTSTTVSSTNSPTINLYSSTGCTIEYTSNSAQVITQRSDYYNLSLSGAGTKTISGELTVPAAFTIGSPLVINANTTSSGSIAVNNNVTINSGKTLNINGSMTGNSTISGGNIVIGGSGAQLTLGKLNVNNLELNRANGSLMYGNVQTVNLTLTQGIFSIGSCTLTINGKMSGSGTLAGSSSSNLVIGGSAATFTLPAGMQLANLTLDRTNGCNMAGNLTVRDVTLSSGTLTIGAGNTLSVSGTIIWTDGLLSVDQNSTLEYIAGFSVGNVYPLEGGILTINCTGRTVNLVDNTSVYTLNLNSGTLSLGANTLTINGCIAYNGGTLSGGDTSSLIISSTVSSAYIPSVTLGYYEQHNNDVNLCGNMVVYNLNLLAGTLNMGDYYLEIKNSVLFLTKQKNPVFISSSPVGGILYQSTLSGIQDLPQFSVGNFTINSPGGCRMTQLSGIGIKLNLINGRIDPNGNLELALGSTIERRAGTLLASPTFNSGHSLIYTQTCVTGYEFPSLPGIIANLTLGRVVTGVMVVAQNNLYVESQISLYNNCTLDLNGYNLFLSQGTVVTGDISSLILGRIVKPIGNSGIDLPSAGIKIVPGIEINDFAVTQLPITQSYGQNRGIKRTWILEGNFNDTVTLTLLWDYSADGEIVFSNLNRAIAYRKSGDYWMQVGNPQDVSLMNPRHITVQTNHFSEWTVGSEDHTLPVVLSYFTAVVNDFNTITLNWVTHSETNMMGYYLYRNTESQFDTALRISNLIEAHNSSYQQSYHFTDNENLNWGTYYYWLQSIELDGTAHTYDYISVTLTEPNNGNVIPPIEIPVISAYPNPFNPDLTVKINQLQTANVQITIHDIKGRLVKVLYEGILQEGKYNYYWNGTDNKYRQQGSGVFFICYQCGNEVIRKKVAFIK